MDIGAHIINSSASAVPFRANCLFWGGPSGLKSETSDLKQALDKAGWTTFTDLAAAGLPGRFDLVIVDEASAGSEATLRVLKDDGAVLASILGGGDLPEEFLRHLDVIFCDDLTRIGLLRAAGKAVHYVASTFEGAGQCLEILERHLRRRCERYPPVEWSRISYGHTTITREEISEEMMTAWLHADIPPRQRALVETQLRAMYEGKIPRVFQVLADALRPYATPGLRLLEVGCASAYYYEILEYLLLGAFDYVGADFSPGLIGMAHSLYPHAAVLIAEGSLLPFPDGHFNVAISSGILPHCPNFRDHVREAARVSGNVVVAHRTPVCRRRPTQFLKKFAYGVKTVELLFNEEEMLEAFRSEGLSLVSAIDLGADPDKDNYSFTYVLEKAGSSLRTG